MKLLLVLALLSLVVLSHKVAKKSEHHGGGDEGDDDDEGNDDDVDQCRRPTLPCEWRCPEVDCPGATAEPVCEAPDCPGSLNCTIRCEEFDNCSRVPLHPEPRCWFNTQQCQRQCVRPNCTWVYTDPNCIAPVCTYHCARARSDASSLLLANNGIFSYVLIPMLLLIAALN